MTTETQTQPGESWGIAAEVWRDFVTANPVLGLNPGPWALTNFLRHAKPALVAADVLRKARGRHWIAHRAKFAAVAFDLVSRAKEAA